MKVRLAMFKSQYGNNHALEEMVAQLPYGLTGHVQLTEYVDVYFPELIKDAVVPQQIKVIDSLIKKEKQDAAYRMNQLEQRKQELLALTQG